MSMNSGLTRDKNGALMRDGKHVILGCDTGDDTPVVQDERLDVDLNRLVSNEMARQETLRIPGQQDYQDLTDYPPSRGAAEHRELEIRSRLDSHMQPGETYENALRRILEEQAKLNSAQREQNAKTSAPTPEPSTPSTPSPTPP